VYAKLDDILNETLKQLFEPLCIVFFKDVNFPRCLKSADAMEKLKIEFLPLPAIKKASTAIQSA
jgi:hypothetical protein